MGTFAFRRHSVHGDDRDIPASQLVLRVEQVLGESAPLAEFTHQHRVNFSSLRQSHDLIARVGVGLGAGVRFLVDVQHVILSPGGEFCQIGNLPFAGLIES